MPNKDCQTALSSHVGDFLIFTLLNTIFNILGTFRLNRNRCYEQNNLRAEHKVVIQLKLENESR